MAKQYSYTDEARAERLAFLHRQRLAFLRRHGGGANEAALAAQQRVDAIARELADAADTPFITQGYYEMAERRWAEEQGHPQLVAGMAECVACGAEITEGEFFCDACWEREFLKRQANAPATADDAADDAEDLDAAYPGTEPYEETELDEEERLRRQDEEGVVESEYEEELRLAGRRPIHPTEADDE